MKYFYPFLFFALIGCIEKGERAEQNLTGNDTVTLQWTIPTRYEDAELFGDDKVAAYYVHWGDTAENLENVETIEASSNQLVLSGIPAGKYYFSVSVETVSGGKSFQSNVVNKEFH